MSEVAMESRYPASDASLLYRWGDEKHTPVWSLLHSVALLFLLSVASVFAAGWWWMGTQDAETKLGAICAVPFCSWGVYVVLFHWRATFHFENGTLLLQGAFQRKQFKFGDIVVGRRPWPNIVVIGVKGRRGVRSLRAPAEILDSLIREIEARGGEIRNEVKKRMHQE